MPPSIYDLEFERQLSRRKSARMMLPPNQFEHTRAPSPPQVQAACQPVSGRPPAADGRPFEEQP